MDFVMKGELFTPLVECKVVLHWVRAELRGGNQMDRYSSPLSFLMSELHGQKGGITFCREQRR